MNLSAVHTITSVKAISLAYFLDVTEEWQKTVGDEWERALLNDIESFGKIYAPDLEVSVHSIPAGDVESVVHAALPHCIHGATRFVPICCF